MLERERELARLTARLAEARVGDGGLAVIEGPAGIGKTTLVAAACALAEQAGMQVLRASGSEFEREFAFGVVRRAFERTLAGIGADELAAVMAGPASHARALFDPHATAPSTEALMHGLHWLLANLAERAPALLVVDDAHWADASSIAALAFLARRVSQLPVALLVSTRPPEIGSPLAALATDPSAERLVPESLGDAAIQTLSGSNDAAFLEAARDATGGNPFLLDQLLREMGDVRRAEVVADIAPRELGRIVLTRVGDGARALAWAMVILGGRATLAECARLGEVERPEAAMDELIAAGVLADSGDLCFRHALIAAAVEAGLSAVQLARWHGRAAAILDAGGADPERVAMHLVHTQPAANAEVVAVLRAAAERAVARGAPGAAEPLLRRALAEPPTAAQRASLLLALGEVLAVTEEAQAAATFAEVVWGSDDPAEQTRALEARARVGWARAAASVESDLVEIDRLLAALPETADDLRLRLETARLTVAQRSEPALARSIARAEAIGLFSPERAQHPDALAVVARWRMQTGHSADECVAYALRAMEAASGAYRVIPPGLWFPLTTMVLQAATRLTEARAAAQALQQATRDYGSPTWYALTTQWHAWLLRDAGSLLDAEEEARLAVDVAGAAGESWMRALPTRTLVDVLLDRGQLEPAARAWRSLGLGDAIPDARPMNELLLTRARLRDAHGDKRGALEDVRELARRSGPPSIADQGGRLHAALLEHATGEHEAAHTSATAALAVAERWGTPTAIGAALRVRALISGDVELLRAAAEHLSSSPRRLDHAECLADLGAALRRSGARRDAREPLEAALALARECGADLLAERVGEELAASGVRVTARPDTGTEALTASERRIARLAADGATNKEIAQSLFLSVKTIEMHLGNAYRKLDIGSRRQLAAAFAASAA